MAQTNFTPISLYYSTTAAAVPTAGNLVAGELAINTQDGKLFYKDAAGVVQTLASKGTGTIGGSTTQVQYNNAGAFAGSANFVWDNTNVRLGIGTTSPQKKLSVSNGGAVGLDIDPTGRSGEAATSLLSYNRSTSAYVPAQYDASQHEFQTSNTERMRITSAGNVGVGTSTPASKFDVLVADGSYMTVNPTTGTNDALSAGIRFLGQNNNVGRAVGIYNYNEGSVDNNAMVFYTNLGSTFTEKMRITGGGQVGIGTASPNSLLNVSAASNAVIELTATGGGPFRHYLRTAGDDLQIRASSGVMQFYTGATDGLSSTERMRITTGGDLCVGKTATTDTTIGSYIGSAGRFGLTSSASTNSSSTVDVYSTGAGNYRFYIGYGGTVYATSTTITAISDQRLKENITDIDVGLDAVMALKPRKFDWKTGKGKDKKGDRGWIAQEFETVFPDMIDEWKDPSPEGEEPYKAVNADLIPVLVKAIQEQQALIENLTTRLNALEGK